MSIKLIKTCANFLAIFTVCLFVTTTIVGCQEDLERYDTNLSYLDFSSDFTSDAPLSDQDVEVLMAAMRRANVVTNNGLLEMGVKSANEINISDRLFGFIQSSIENGNSLLLEDLENLTLAPRTRSDGEINWLELLGKDCVPHCIGFISAWLDFTDTYVEGYNSASSYIDANGWTNGVPGDKMYQTLRTFFGVNVFRSLTLDNSTPYETLLVVGRSHAVIYTGHFDHVVYYYDPQKQAHRVMLNEYVDQIYNVDKRDY